MFFRFHKVRRQRIQMSRRALLRIVAPFSFLALAACDPAMLDGFGGQEGQRINPNAPVPVALLVPRGSGNQGDDILAQSLEDAARLAIAELDGARIDLRVYSTAGNPQTAASQAQQAVDDGAKVILGPVYAEAANAVGVAVADDNVNVLAFSNNPTIAGGNVFILGPTFANTANRLVGYARSQNRDRILVVHSQDLAGELGRDAIVQAISRNGSTLSGTVPYSLSQEGVVSAVPRIKSATDGGNANAIFMTSTTAGALPLLSQLLPEAGVSNTTTQFIGLTRWDIPRQTLDLPGIQGGWFALPDPARSAAFRSRYSAAYGQDPHPIGGLAFDGIAAIGALTAQGQANALTRSALTQRQGFQGVNGVFRLNPDGSNDRGLAIATIRNNQVAIIDPAPQSFAGF